MKRNIFIVSILLAILTFAIQIDNAIADELEEFKKALKRYTTVWENFDAENAQAAAEIEAEAIGFSSSGRMTPMDHATMDINRAIVRMKRYQARFEVFEFSETWVKVKVIGNTGIACGHFTIKKKTIGGPLETIQGRESLTYLKKDGQWKMVLYHRDIPTNK